MLRLVEELRLIAEDGRTKLTYIYQDYDNTPDRDGIPNPPGLRYARLQDGTPLNRVDENTFRNVITGELLRRRDR
jgi:hypothetical protein